MATKVPMFLLKLYKIVSDPNTNDIICWSDSGDSFFVHDHERLAKLLGNWFKHNKFASFVRQLNIYGFRKIPDLRQGTLRSDSDAECSQFAHPDFLRGQEDRLILIERKQAASNGKSEQQQQGTVDFPIANAPATQPPAAQTLNLRTVINGVAAIRLHQAQITSELNALRNSNQLLWQEAREARSRYQKQQVAIDSIVKFLGSVFGQHATSPGGTEVEQGPSPHSVTPKSRLMIENKETDNVDFVEGGAVSSISRDQSPQPFSSIETLGSSASQTSSSGAIELSPSSASQTPGFGLDLALPGSEHPTPFSPSAFNLCLPGEMQQSYNFNPNSVEPNSFQQQNQLPSSSTSVIPSRGLFDLLSGSQPHHQPSSSGQITLNGANDLLLSQRNQMTVLEQSMDLVDSKIDEIDQWIHGPGPLATGTEFNEADGGYSNTSSGLDAPSSDMPTMDSTVDELFGPYTFPSPVGGGVNYGNDGTMDVSFINPVILSEKSSALVPSPEHATTSHAGLGNTSTSAQKRNLDAGEPSSPKAKRRKG